MNLRDYINLNQTRADRALARRSLAEKVGVAETTVRSWVNGNRYPSRFQWKRIEDATDSQVKAITFIE